MHRISWRIRRAPLSIVKWQFGYRRCCDLRADGTHSADYRVWIRDQLQFLATFVKPDSLHSVVVRGNEVKGDAILSSEANGFRSPCVSGTCWSTHAIIRGNGLDRLCGGFVQLEVFRLIARPEDVKVGFIPDFKVPLLNFPGSVTRGPMLDQGFNKLLPLVVVLWRSDVALPPEHAFGATSQRLRHEAKFDKRLHADVQYGVIEGVDVLEVIDWPALPVFAVYAEFILQQTVKTDVLETTLAMDHSKISLPIGAQAFRGATSTDYLSKELIVWSFDL